MIRRKQPDKPLKAFSNKEKQSLYNSDLDFVFHEPKCRPYVKYVNEANAQDQSDICEKIPVEDFVYNVDSNNVRMWLTLMFNLRYNNPTVYSRHNVHKILKTLSNCVEFCIQYAHNIQDVSTFRTLAQVVFDIRHEILHLLDSDVPDHIIGSDYNFTDLLGINLSPDIYLQNSNGVDVKLIEYTVSNDINKTLFQKGGWNLRKYDSIQVGLEALGKRVQKELKFLNSSNEDTNVNFKCNQEFYGEVCKSVNKLGMFAVSCSNQHPQWMVQGFEDMVDEVMFTGLFELTTPFERRNNKIICYMPDGFNAAYQKCKEELLDKLTGMIHRTNAGCTLLLNPNRKTLILKLGDGNSPAAMYDAIINRDLKILSTIIFIQRGRSVLKYNGEKGEINYVNHTNFNYRKNPGVDWKVDSVKKDEKKLFLLPQINDIDKLKKDVLSEAFMMENSGRDFLVDSELTEDVVIRSVRVVQRDFQKINTVTDGEVHKIAPITRFYLCTPELLRPGRLNEFDQVLTLNFSSALYTIIKAKIKDNDFKRDKRRVQNKTLRQSYNNLNANIRLRKNELISSIDVSQRKSLGPSIFKNDPNLKTMNVTRKLLSNEMKSAEKEVENPNGNIYISVNQKELEMIKEVDYFNWQNDGDKKTRGKCGHVNVIGFIDNLLGYLAKNVKLNTRFVNIMKYDYTNDIPIFEKLNTISMDNYKMFYDQMKTMRVMGIADFNSRLCYSLLHHSRSAHQGHEFMIENLGFENVLLMIRGGKTIFKTQSSRHFRLIIPVDDELYQLMTLGKNNHSYERYNDYVLTPWMQLREAEIIKGISMYHSFTEFGSVNMNRSNINNYTLDNHNMIWPMLLSLHGRRKTEATLHSLRYPTVNCLGKYTKLLEMLREMVFSAKDHFQYALQQTYINNFLDFYKGMVDKHYVHPFTKNIVNDEYELTSVIYSTYLMPKSPIDSIADQVSNLGNVMKKHSDFFDETDTPFLESQRLSIPDKLRAKWAEIELEFKDLPYKTDFGIRRAMSIKFDKEKEKIKSEPALSNNSYKRSCYYDTSLGYTDCSNNFLYSTKASYLAGVYASNMFNKDQKIIDISSEWEKIMNGSWVDLANPSGLRKKGKLFFGNKGNFIMTEELLNIITEEDVHQIAEMFDEKRKERRYKGFYITYASKIVTINDHQFLFHIVHKIQRGGGREIYAMDVVTKTLQQPLEKMFGFLCKFFDNEFISVPSSQRLHKIHSKVHNREFNNFLFATLDCKRWAPQSNLNKYVAFVLGMADSLPEGFVVYFLGFMHEYYNKEVHINKKVFKSFFGGDNKDKYLKFFEQSKYSASYCFKMPYSFMMGIFNFLSSLMHVANILMANDLINEILITRGYSPEFVADIMAHSDDSGGIFSAGCDQSLVLGIKFYEIFLSLCNHNLSLKKCVLSSCYLEFLSVLYINKQLLPLVNKFASNLEPKMNDKGPCHDLAKSGDKCVEILTFGGTFEEALLKKHLYSNLILDFYKMPYTTNLPPQAGGCPASHPIMDLMLGSNSDTVRLFKKDPERLIKVLTLISLSRSDLGTDSIPFLESTMPVQINAKLADQKQRLEKRVQLILDKINETDDGTKIVNLLTMSGYKHPVNKLLAYNELYKKNSYVNSLMYEDEIRMISRSQNIVNSNCIRILDRMSTPRMITANIEDDLLAMESGVYLSQNTQLCKFPEIERGYRDIMENVYDLSSLILDKFSSINVGELNFLKNNVTCKPCTFSFKGTNSNLKLSSNIFDIILQNRYPRYSFLTNVYKDTSHDYNMLISKFGDLTDEQLIVLSKKYDKSSFKRFYMYSQVESNHRIIETQMDYLDLLKDNQRYHSEVVGLIYDKRDFVEQFENDYEMNVSILSEIKTMELIQSYTKSVPYFKEPSFVHCGKEYTYEELMDTSSVVNELIPVYVEKNSYNQKQTPRTNLCEKFFWFCWLKKQVRVADSWTGPQQILMKLGEYTLDIDIHGSNMSIRTKINGTKSFTSLQSTLWKLFCEQLNINTTTATPNNTEDIALGINKLTNKWGFFRQMDCDYIIQTENVNYDILSMVKDIKHSEGRFSLTHSNKKCKINTLEDITPYGQDVKRFIKPSGQFVLDDNIIKCVDKLIELNLLNFNITLQDLLQNFSQSNIASVIYEASVDACDMQQINNNFKLMLLKNIKNVEYNDQSFLDLLLKLKIDPNTVPEDIKDSYTMAITLGAVDERKSEYMEDFVRLVSINDEAEQANFIGKWGLHAYGMAATISEEKDISVLRCLDYNDHCHHYGPHVINCLNNVCIKFQDQISSYVKSQFFGLWNINSLKDYFYSSCYSKEKTWSGIIFIQVVVKIFSESEMLTGLINELDKNQKTKKILCSESLQPQFLCYLMSYSRYLADKKPNLDDDKIHHTMPSDIKHGKAYWPNYPVYKVYPRLRPGIDNFTNNNKKMKVDWDVKKGCEAKFQSTFFERGWLVTACMAGIDNWADLQEELQYVDEDERDGAYTIIDFEKKPVNKILGVDQLNFYHTLTDVQESLKTHDLVVWRFNSLPNINEMIKAGYCKLYNDIKPSGCLVAVIGKRKMVEYFNLERYNHTTTRNNYTEYGEKVYGYVPNGKTYTDFQPYEAVMKTMTCLPEELDSEVWVTLDYSEFDNLKSCILDLRKNKNKHTVEFLLGLMENELTKKVLMNLVVNKRLDEERLMKCVFYDINRDGNLLELALKGVDKKYFNLTNIKGTGFKVSEELIRKSKSVPAETRFLSSYNKFGSSTPIGRELSTLLSSRTTGIGGLIRVSKTEGRIFKNIISQMKSLLANPKHSENNDIVYLYYYLNMIDYDIRVEDISNDNRFIDNLSAIMEFLTEKNNECFKAPNLEKPTKMNHKYHYQDFFK